MKTLFTRCLSVMGLATFLFVSSVQAEGINPDLPYEETFEALTNGYSLLYDDTTEGIPPRDNGWWFGNSNDIASVSNHLFTYLAPGYPYISGTQSNVLYFETATGSKGISNLFPTVRTNMYMEMMLRPGRMDAEESPLVKSVTNNCHLAMYVNTNGFLTIYHTLIITTGDYVWDEDAQTNVWVEGDPIFLPDWTTLSHTPVGSNDWIRVLIELCVESEGLPRFQIRLNNGLPMTDTNAFFLSGESVDTTQRGGTWFVSALYTLKTFSGISIGGMGMIDDIRIQQGVPLNLLTFGVIPTVDAPGTISPSNTFYLVQAGGTNVDIAAPLYWYIADVETNNVSVGGSFGTNVADYTHTISDIQSDINIHGIISPRLAANGTPLWWLATNGFYDFDVDETNDFDGDRSPTWQEFQLETDPTNPLSVRYLIEPSVSGNGTIVPSTNLYVWGFRPTEPVFAITADPNYIIEDILTNGVSIGEELGVQSINYTWANVSSSGSIHAVIGAGFPPPANVVASDGTYTDRVYVAWALISGSASNFMVYRDTGSNPAVAPEIGQTTNSFFEDTSASAGIRYYYWIKASNETFVTSFSASDTGYLGLGAPLGIAASDALYPDKITVSWTAVNNATGYEVWQNTTNEIGTATQAMTTAGTTVDVISNIVVGTSYWYWVRATNAVANGGFGTPDTGSLQYVAAPILLIPSVDLHGSIEPSTNIWVEQGATTNFLITASNYYYVSGVLTNGGTAVAGNFGVTYNFVYSNIAVVGTGTVHGLIGATVTANNGTPHYWLAEYGLTNTGLTFEEAATNDSDKDAMSAGDEYIAGTDPTDPDSIFKIVFRGIQNGSNVVKWLGGTSGGAMTNPYQILVRTNLTSGTWAGTGVANRVEITNTWMDKAPTNSRVFFYRIKATD